VDESGGGRVELLPRDQLEVALVDELAVEEDFHRPEPGEVVTG